jgi:outer membrane protein assembly factor BamB
VSHIPLLTTTISGEELWRLSEPTRVQSSPAIGVDGTVYFGTADNKVYAVGGDNKICQAG